MTEKTLPIKGSAYSFITSLASQTNPLIFKDTPTLAAGDVKVDKDGGGLNNLASLPTASGKLVTVSLSATEMNADEVTVIFSDAAGSEWCDSLVVLRTSVSGFAIAGAGASANTYTVYESDGTTPIADCDVWVTTDLAGSNVVASGTSGALGTVTFYLDAGTTYYIWRQKDGWNFSNPDQEVAV